MASSRTIVHHRPTLFQLQKGQVCRRHAAVTPVVRQLTKNSTVDGGGARLAASLTNPCDDRASDRVHRVLGEGREYSLYFRPKRKRGGLERLCEGARVGEICRLALGQIDRARVSLSTWLALLGLALERILQDGDLILGRHGELQFGAAAQKIGVRGA